MCTRPVGPGPGSTPAQRNAATGESVDREEVEVVVVQAVLDLAARAGAALIGIPALDGVEAKLTRGALVADVGCGAGVSTIVMARAYPRSRFFGFDPRTDTIERARWRAEHAGVADRVRFEVARATDYPGSGYDLVAHLDDLRATGDPTAAARHTRRAMAPDGTWMIALPRSSDQLAEARLRPVVIAGGLTRLRRATHTPFHLVLEARA